jgi:uncharacterized protein (DUF2237 family)
MNISSNIIYHDNAQINTSKTMSFHPDPEINRLNVLGEPLASCCFDPITGYYRDGFCHTGYEDMGLHTVCAQMTDDFLDFSKRTGNDLSTPRPELHFTGLKAGDFWCICVTRWVDAYQQHAAPLIKIQSCHQSVLQFVDLNILLEYAL